MRERLLQSKILVALRAITLTAVAIIGAVAPAEAQPRGHRGEERIRALVEQLELDASQQAALRALFERAAQGREGLRALPRGSDEARQAHRRSREGIKSGIAQILTPEQRARMGELKLERRLQHLTQRLGLDARQVAAVRAILADAASRADAAPSDGADGRRQQHAQIRARITQVLTPAQRTTFDQSRAQRGGHHRGCRPRRGEIDT